MADRRNDKGTMLCAIILKSNISLFSASATNEIKHD